MGLSASNWAQPRLFVKNRAGLAWGQLQENLNLTVFAVRLTDTFMDGAKKVVVKAKVSGAPVLLP